MSTPEELDFDPGTMKATPGKVWCTYCGKRFTRKEHLERHIPSHTNVKPYRCSACTLGFTRRDLLTRHYTTYHEPRNSTEPPAGGLPTMAGRNQISCLTCANAKTGCDKKVPCSRCAEKGLPCEPRYARRSSKAAVRAAQAAIAAPQLSQQVHPAPGSSLAMMDASQSAIKPEVSHSPSVIEVAVPGYEEDGLSARATPQHSLISPVDFQSPHPRIDNSFDDYMSFHSNFGLQLPTFENQGYQTHTPHDQGHQDFFMDFDMLMHPYSGAAPFAGTPLPLAPLPDPSDVSPPTSDLMSTSMSGISSRGSIQTVATSRTSLEPEDELRALMSATATHSGEPVSDLKAVVQAEAGWNLARCNPLPAEICPRTALVHLECLERKSKQEGTWNALEKYLEQVDWGSSDLALVVPLTTSTRDRMLAITQSFLHKALENHRGSRSSQSRDGSVGSNEFNFLVLPSSRILEYFLRSYVRSLSAYYPLITAGRVDPNEMLENNRASTLLLLLMIAQGAAAMPMIEARYLSAGLTETCRVSLFDIVEKDVELTADPVTLRCALLFIVLGVWSGDKWLMDIAMGQRGMYISMLRHAGMLEPPPQTMPQFNDSMPIELQWHEWVQRETKNRLVYNYVMLDQELALFHDTAPLFAITELHCSLPEPEVLWLSENSEQWFNMMQSIHSCTVNVNPQLLSSASTTTSLHKLFSDFLQNDFLSQRLHPSPQQLRLILHPLQTMIHNLRQTVSCLPGELESLQPSGNPVTRESLLGQLKEMQALLEKWYDFATDYLKTNPKCPITQCSLILYHLVYLNTMTDFPEIERMARREGFGGSSWELQLRHGKCIFQQENKVMLHCGQTLRMLRSMPRERRPVWWPAALYRATLVLWADSVTRLQPCVQADGGHGNLGRQNPGRVMIDRLAPDHPTLMDLTWNNVGKPGLSCLDGGVVSLDNPSGILGYAVQQLGLCYSSRIVDGIKRKMVMMRNIWDGMEGGGTGISPGGSNRL